MKMARMLFLVMFSVYALGYAQNRQNTATNSGGKKMALELISSAFNEGQFIPAKYTADGADVSPPLKWTQPPPTAKSFALVCDDPDAPRGTWVHWVVYNIPPTTLELSEGMPKGASLPGGIRQGRTDFGTAGYGGPAPPKGPVHRYFFRLYALDTAIDLKPGATKAELMNAIQGRVIAQATLMGKYQRK